MSTFSRLILGACLNLFFIYSAFAQYQFISPVPNSQYHNPETNIILKSALTVNEKSLKGPLVQITGSISGEHTCRIVLSGDQKTILLYPAFPFAFNETVQVSVADGFETMSGEIITGTSFSFQIHPARTAETTAAIHKAYQRCREEEFGVAPEVPSNAAKMPPECNFPETEITSTGNEYVAPVFMRNQRLNDNICFARQIMDNNGDSIYAEFDEMAGIDFKINLNGYLTYFDKSDSSFAMMDSGYNLVKKFYMGNGYPCDEHDFLVYPDGHAFLMCYDAQIVDMSVIVAGGLVDAVVLGLVLQELDEAGNVIFQWRSWDHLEITDAVDNYVNLTLPEIDYVHGNSIDIDTDGNLLVSCRHLSSILKINKLTGEIMWQMGGENNDFTFPNETGVNHFFYQHHFRLLPDGNYSLFNNANYQVPQASSAKIYSLDQTTKTATLVWEYVHPKITGYNQVSEYYVYGRAMGNVELLPNGNWLIGWGLLTNTHLAPFPNITEVDSAGNIVWEMRYTDSTLVTYRAFKFDFIRCGFIADSSLLATYVGYDSVDLAWDNSNNATSYIFQYRLFGAPDWISIPLETNSISLNGLQQQSVYEWRVQSVCEAYNDSSAVTAIHVFNTIFNGLSSVHMKSIGLNIYPNPATGVTNLNVIVPESGNFDLLITNIMGEKILEKEITVTPNRSLVPLQLYNWTPGMYSVQLSNGQTVITRPLLVH